MKKRSRVLVGLCALVAVFGVSVVATGADQHSEQIIFSGTGFGTFDGTPSPFGFWIWCEDADAQNPYAGECNGAMYIYALRLTRGVEGEVSETSEGIYQMTVSSRKNASLSCQLTNQLNDEGELNQGPNNIVDVTCTTPSGGGQSTNAVVNVTGPEEEE